MNSSLWVSRSDLNIDALSESISLAWCSAAQSEITCWATTSRVNWPLIHSSQGKWGQIKAEHKKHVLRTQGLSRNYWKEGMFSRFSIQNAVSSPLVVLVYGSTRAFIQPEFSSVLVFVCSSGWPSYSTKAVLFMSAHSLTAQTVVNYHIGLSKYSGSEWNIFRGVTQSKKGLPLVCHRVHCCTFWEQMITSTL